MKLYIAQSAFFICWSNDKTLEFWKAWVSNKKFFNYIKTQKFWWDKISDFFSVRILIRPKFWVVRNYFLPKFFENGIFLFFLAVIQMKINIEDQFLEGNMWEKKKKKKKNTILLKWCTCYVSNQYKLCCQFRHQIDRYHCHILLVPPLIWFWYILPDSQFQCLVESLKCNFLWWFLSNVPYIFFSRLLFWTGPSIKFQVLLLEWARGSTFHPKLYQPFFHLSFSANTISSFFRPFPHIFPIIMPSTTCYFAA